MVPYYMDNRSNSRANTCVKPRLSEGVHLLDSNHQPLGVSASLGFLMASHNN